MPSTWDKRCAMMVEATSYKAPRVMLGEVSAITKMGESAGLTLR